MEKKNFLTAGLVLAAAGFTVAATPLILRRSDSIALQREMLELIQSRKDDSVTLQDLSYYLDEQARANLTNAAYVHLKRAQYSKFASQLSAASQAILLSGPEGTEAYHQRIAKALAHNFEAKLLLLDVADLASKTRVAALTRKRSTRPSASSLARDVHRGLVGLLMASNASGSTLPQAGITAAVSANSVCDIKVCAGLSGAAEKKTDVCTTASGLPGKSASCTRRPVVFEEEIFVDALFKVLQIVSETSPMIVYLRDVENFFLRGPKMYSLFSAKIKRLQGPIMVLGSRIKSSEEKPDAKDCSEKLGTLFRYKISVKPPENNAQLSSWKSQVEEDMKAIQAQDNRNRIIEVLYANNLECEDILSVGFCDTVILSNCIEEVVVSALSHHLMNMEEPEYRSGRLVISSKSLLHGLNLFQAGCLDSTNKLQGELHTASTKDLQETMPSAKSESKSEGSGGGSDVKTESAKVETTKPESTRKGDSAETAKPTTTTTSAKPAEVAPDNEFEKRIRPEVIPAGEIGVNFQDIGALENVKEALEELVMLPLQRPEFFNRGGLVKRCKGILLFGPPGTGKTMLAKAVATEAGASFINVSMSAITSKWFGEDEKNVRALFTLAAKVSPTVIFIDEVDSMLGQRSRVGEHEAMRKIKNEFMAHWDGLLTKSGERVLVLAATNRPFDLDEAIIRRFERRIMVGLPDANNREKILRAILSKEELADEFDFTELANMTEGYSGSDLKNLCVAGAYRPVRELLSRERKKELEKQEERKRAALSEDSEPTCCARQETDNAGQESEDSCPCQMISLRPLSIQDMREARKQVSASFAVEGTGMQELQDWNDLYGEGGFRKKQQLTYFL